MGTISLFMQFSLENLKGTNELVNKTSGKWPHISVLIRKRPYGKYAPEQEGVTVRGRDGQQLPVWFLSGSVL